MNKKYWYVTGLILIVALAILGYSLFNDETVGFKISKTQEFKKVIPIQCKTDRDCRINCVIGQDCPMMECIKGTCTQATSNGASRLEEYVTIGGSLRQKFGEVIGPDRFDLWQGDIKLNEQSYKAKEVIELLPTRDDYIGSFRSSGVGIASSLTSNEDLYGSNVYLEMPSRDLLKYRFIFNDNINLARSNISQGNPLIINFLGKPLKIVGIDGPTIIKVLPEGYKTPITYRDGDAYIGQNTNDPDWVWDLANLTTFGNTHMIAIENDNVWNDYSDGSFGIGDCINIPGETDRYFNICLDKLTIPDDQYKEYKFELDTCTDLSDVGDRWVDNTCENTIFLQTTQNQGLLIRKGIFDFFDNLTEDVKIKEIWFHMNKVSGYGDLEVFYRDPTSGSNAVQYAGTTDGYDTGIVRVNYENTVNSNIELDVVVDSSELNLTWNIIGDSFTDLPDGYDDVNMLWEIRNYGFDKITSLGHILGTEELEELQWNWSNGNGVNIGTKNNNLRSIYGIIIKNPSVNGANDQVIFLIPNDQVFAQVSLNKA